MRTYAGGDLLGAEMNLGEGMPDGGVGLIPQLASRLLNLSARPPARLRSEEQHASRPDETPGQQANPDVSDS